MKMIASTRSRERGVAMIVALFALLLLSVIGLGMMYSTNMESAINNNYRDKQVSLYAALGGLQEARDRLKPAAPTVTVPTALPSLTAANVVYIVSDYGTVKPWLTTSEYFDTELCQENVLGLSGTPGVPCTTVPSGTTWLAYVDNSQMSSAPWNLANPLDLKWTRITLKGNNMTPYPVNGNSSTSTQVCWDGSNQILLPSGYGTGCNPIGGVTTLTITNYGSGYTSAPTVTISAPPAGGTQATASVVTTTTTDGWVSAVSLVTGGTAYESAPAVQFVGGGGSGATATATISNGGAPVTGLTGVTLGTKCYPAGSPPTISFVGGGGSGAAATATLEASASCIYDWTLNGNCTDRLDAGNGYSPEDTKSGVTFAAGNASFSGTLNVASSNHKSVLSHPSCCTIQNPGTGYTANFNSTLTLTHCNNLTTTATVGYRLASVALTAGGNGYTSAPSVVFGGAGVGTTATSPSATATIGAVGGPVGSISGITVTNGGSGYTTAPSVVFVGGSGSGAVAVATIDTTTTTAITGLNITNAGAGYTSNPTVTFSGGGGSGAAATATIGRGTTYGKVYLVTTLGQTDSGARTMAQTEIASPVLGVTFTGALTVDGPNPVISGLPNSAGFGISGNDANSCMGTAQPAHPAIGGYDDPNASPATDSVQTIIDAIPDGREANYTGSGGAPSVENVYDSVGETMGTPAGLKAFIDAVKVAPGANVYTNNPGSIDLGTMASPEINYVEGNLTLSGSSTGYGILVVTGTLVMGGNFGWNGPVFVVGDGIADLGGGGTGVITGSVVVAKIWDNYTNKNLLTALGSPTVSWNGGGSNRIQYDHCWADDLMSNIPFTPPPSTKPLKVLSTRILPY